MKALTMTLILILFGVMLMDACKSEGKTDQQSQAGDSPQKTEQKSPKDLKAPPNSPPPPAPEASKQDYLIDIDTYMKISSELQQQPEAENDPKRLEAILANYNVELDTYYQFTEEIKTNPRLRNIIEAKKRGIPTSGVVKAPPSKKKADQ